MKRLSVITAIILSVFTMSIVNCFAAADQSYVVDSTGKTAIPLAYDVAETIVSFDLKPSMADEPTDICIGPDDSLYILDSGNSRIVKLSADRKKVSDIRPTSGQALSEPEGIFVDKNNNIYVADTGNGRVVKMNQKGEVDAILVQPDDATYDTEYPFRPTKVGVDTLGQIYIINKNDYHGFIILNERNDFLGYFATNRVSNNILARLVSKFASDSQKEQMGQEMPPVHSNLCITDDGSIYVTTVNVEETQIKRLSPTGTNFYPNTGVFGEEADDSSLPNFVDIVADEDGILTALDSTSGKLYQYDESGVMLSAFGGEGIWRGHVMNGVALAMDSESNIYVLDKTMGSVQVFKSTDFTDKVHTALRYHSNGDYDNSESVWSDILKKSNNYAPACIGMAKVKEKQKDYLGAMTYYKQANDKSGYSSAFVDYQTEIVRNHFPLVALGVIVVVTIIILFVSTVKRRSDYLDERCIETNEIKGLGIVTFFVPSDTFRTIKKNRGNLDLRRATGIFAAAVVVNVLRQYLYSYQTIGTNIEDINLLSNVFGFVVPFALWCIGYYYVTNIFEGEVVFSEVYAATCYALLPFVVFSIPIALYSNIVGISSVGTINTLMAVVWLWVILLVLIGIKTMNNITVGKTIQVVLVSICATIFIALIFTFIYLLGIQLIDFIKEVINECIYAIG